MPELDLSSSGATEEDARRNVKEAVRGFLDASAERGTPAAILSEAGYTRVGDEWRAPEFISLDRATISVK